MGLRFKLDFNTANWLAYLIQPRAPMPRIPSPQIEREALQNFVSQLENRFYSTPRRESQFQRRVDQTLRLIEQMETEERVSPRLLLALRSFLADRLWTALLVPSGRSEVDRIICSEEFLRYLLQIEPDDSGLILQIEDPLRSVFTLTDVFPAFRTALTDSTSWPGVLIWTRRGDSVFLPFGSTNEDEIKKTAKWIFTHLAEAAGSDLEMLKSLFYRQRRVRDPRNHRRMHLVQLSDLHLGSDEASRRLPRVKQLVRNVLEKLGEDSPIVLVITGDLMNTPDDRNLNSVRDFFDFLNHLGTRAQILVLGNHDVRRNGFLDEKLQQAIKLPNISPHIEWYPDQRVALVCFNTVVGGILAQGSIGEVQLSDLGNELDNRKDWRDFALVGVMHHHPIPVENPDWHVQQFYEKLLGKRLIKKTQELEDADSLLDFVRARQMAAIVHGHKHIPRIDQLPDSATQIVGCGSTVGKVEAKIRTTYMSLNIVTIDSTLGQLSIRLLAERIPGAGLNEFRSHEVLYRGNL